MDIMVQSLALLSRNKSDRFPCLSGH